MAKIDLEKLICSLAKRKYFSEEKLQGALKEQGLEYKDGEIVESQKPKFKVGDWITTTDDEGNIAIEKIIEFWGDKVRLIDTDGVFVMEPKYELKNYHLWTIQDAKDGDILACGDKVTDYPFIFHNLTEILNPRSYCGVNALCDFQENDENGGYWCDSDEVRPATKEQRDFLFSKMHEAGYEWNAEMKELEKVEPADEIGRKFKVGDIVQYITDSTDRRKIVGVDTLCDMYTTDSSPIMFEVEDEWKVVVNAEDIEQNPAPEPNFNVGDWVVDNHGKVNQVTSVTDDSYAFTLYDGTYVSGCWKDYYHLWTIQDAKDGDVLAAKECYVIFKEIDGLNIKCHCTYHYMGFNTSFHINTLQNKTAFQPATKEQRDLLFQKIEENGYKWDNEKKELKKIEKTRPMLSDFFNAEYERGKASFANRQLYNRAILAILSNYVEKYPDIRFGQMLFNLDIKPHFDEESREAYLNLSKAINKRK